MRLSQLSAAAGLLVVPWLAVRLDLRGLMGTQQPPIASIDVVNSGYPIERGACLTIALGPSAAAECGNLRIVHPLPSTRTFNKLRTPTLLYNSEFAHPYPTIPVLVTITSTTTTPVSVEAVLEISIAGVYQPRDTGLWAGNEWPANQTTTRRITMAYDGISDTTGWYPYRVTVTNLYPGGVRYSAPATGGKMFHINRSQATGFGAGWWLAGLEKLKNHTPTADEIVWIGGDGSARFFVKHWSLPNTWYTALYEKADTLYFDGASTWTKTDAEGVRTKFDAAGNHTQTIDRFGRITQFAYGSGRLSTITLPAPASSTYQFTYTSGRLTSVTAPPIGATTRITTVTNPAGQITGIRNPGDSAVTFTYLTNAGSQNLIAKRLNRRATVDTFVYDSARRVRSSRIKMGGAPTADIVSTLLAGETRGLANQATTPWSLDTAKVYTHLDGPRTDVADTTVMYQSRFGPPRRLIDALAQETKILHGPLCGFSCGWVPLRVQNPVGRVMLAEYDVRGNPLRIIDSVTPIPAQRDTTRYAWDGKFDQLTRIVPPERDSTVFFVSTTNGRRDSLQDARGQPSRVKFGYDPTYVEQVTSMTLPLVGGASAVYQYGYGSTRRNLASVTTPKGYVTSYTDDAIGRIITTQSPVDSAPSSNKKVEQRLGFDLLDRVLGDTTTTLNVTPVENIYVRNYYNPEGQLDSVQRWTSPDPETIGVVTNRWRYDNAGRAVAAVPVGNNIALKDSTQYDEAGNAVTLVTRRYPSPSGPFITMQYDALNRLTQRIVPAVTRSAPPFGVYQPPNLLPTYPYTVKADTQTFTFQPDGQIRSAFNRFAKITRGYDILGRLRGDTLQVATILGPFSGHVYINHFAHDRNGRRTSTEVPSIFAIGTRDTINYAWDPQIGELSQVKDIAGNAITMTYNARREPLETAYPGNYTRALAWDADGRMLRDTVRNGGGTAAPRWPYAAVRMINLPFYDARGKILQSIDGSFFADVTKATYSGLGLDLTAKFQQQGDNQTGSTTFFGSQETFTYDPLANMSTLDRRDSASGGGGYSVVVTHRDYTYQAATGRLTGVSQTVPIVSTTTNTFDSAGNVQFDAESGFGAGSIRRERASIYGLDGRLRAVDMWTSPTIIGPTAKRIFEEYRYDALGRRVLVWMQSHCIGSNDAECYTPFVRRVIWDGQQELAEIQARGRITDTTHWEQDTGGTQVPYNTPNSYPDPNRFYGQVVYAPGLTVDAPLSVTRYSYTDTPTSNNWVTWPGTQTIVPYWNQQGMFTVGAFADGAADKAYNGATSCVPLGSGANRCYLVEWLSARTAYDLRFGNTLRYVWHGSLLEGKRDVSAYDYRRNRFYDPRTGRFTQEDPIGLAGGLNLYGFANGDPVNFSDPFGLCPVCFVAWGIFEAGSAVYDIYQTYKAFQRSPGEGAEALQWAMAGALTPGPGMAYQKAGAQLHHIATNKSIQSGFTAQFERLFGKAGMSLNDAANKVLLEGHKGRHAAQYHQYVLDRLTAATEGLSGANYSRALREELGALRQDLLRNPDLVRGRGIP